MTLMRGDTNLVGGLRELISLFPPQGCVMAEVGSYRGESAAIFIERVAKIYCVDPWVKIPPYPDIAEVEAAFDVFAAAHPDKVVKMRMGSWEAANHFAAKTLDVVYIDGLHDYDFVLKDIQLWRPKVKPGGIISGHDFHNSNTGVGRAVTEVFGSAHRLFRDDSWMVRVPA